MERRSRDHNQRRGRLIKIKSVEQMNKLAQTEGDRGAAAAAAIFRLLHRSSQAAKFNGARRVFGGI